MTVWALTAAVVLSIALVACEALRRRTNASLRHFILAAAFFVVLAVPAVMELIARVEPVRRVHSMVVLTVTPDAKAPRHRDEAQSSNIRWSSILAGLWATGAVLCIVRLGIARPRKWRATVLAPDGDRLARDLGIRRKVRFGESDHLAIPETHGFLRPVVVLPSAAHEWSEERLHVVLTHELIHIARHDWLAGVLAEASAALHWFNPLAWIALRRLRLEREAACDDAVLARGIGACDYAEHLIGIVAGLRSPGCASSVAMAQTSQIEHRIRSILNPHLKRGGLTMKTKWGVSSVAALVLITLVAFQAPAQSGTAGLSGTVLDASSARIPYASVIVRNTGSKATEITRTSETGEFSFTNLPAGTYNVEIAKAGFQLYKQENVALAAGSAQNLSAVLNVGRVNETVNVSAQRTGAKPMAADANRPPQRLRIGGNMQAAKVVNMVRPEYPAHLKAAGTEGTVLLEAVIGTDGHLMNVQVLNSQVHPDLSKAATDAVQQWQWEPTYLNGVPVEVVTAITVNFTLK